MNLMKFNKRKCQILLLERKNPKHQCRLETNHLERVLQKRTWGVLVENKLNLSLAAKKANILLSCITWNITSRLRKVIFHL